MSEYPNLAALLERRAEEGPDRIAFTFLGANRETITYGELAIKARGLAHRLAEHARPGDRVMLVYPGGLEYIAGFFASLYAGLIAVPAYPPRPHKNVPDQNLERLKAIARDAEPALLLATENLAGRIRELDIEELRSSAVLATDALELDSVAAPGLDFGGERIAYLQYTSGSTGQPRGVVISHGQLLANEEMIKRIASQTADSVVVGWLPLYHDMGLIGQVLQPIYNGGHCVLSSPMSFLQKPLRWLQAMDEFGGTTGIAPNFGYELCVERITPAEIAELDLSRWTKAFIGSEPIRADIMRSFARAFAPAGFQLSTFYPCYGLAEATLAVTGTRTRPRFASMQLDAADLAQGRVRVVAAAAPSAPAQAEVPADSGHPPPGTIEIVSCGAPAVNVDLRIVDPRTGQCLDEGQVGEIWARGPAVAAGYWNRPEETARVFAGRLAREDDRAPGGDRTKASPQPGAAAANSASAAANYLRTGDLGFLKDGELYVTGRTKELVILDGRNLYPHDLEKAAEASHPAFRAGSSAAFAVNRGTGEELILALEIRREARRAPVEDLRRAVRGALSKNFGVGVRDILLLRAGSLPRTSSGKMQRIKTRLLYLTGELTPV